MPYGDPRQWLLRCYQNRVLPSASPPSSADDVQPVEKRRRPGDFQSGRYGADGWALFLQDPGRLLAGAPTGAPVDDSRARTEIPTYPRIRGDETQQNKPEKEW
ncbi:hypothetical protein ALUC_11020S [Aspergillus luchuensis]|nr:hypothetical protein ALUC_11020S [Aspergillus luchuensis]